MKKEAISMGAAIALLLVGFILNNKAGPLLNGSRMLGQRSMGMVLEYASYGLFIGAVLLFVYSINLIINKK